MVDVRIMGMTMGHAHMPMAVTMRLRRIDRAMVVIVLMMFVMDVLVFMLHGVMGVVVSVPFRKV